MAGASTVYAVCNLLGELTLDVELHAAFVDEQGHKLASGNQLELLVEILQRLLGETDFDYANHLLLVARLGNLLVGLLEAAWVSRRGTASKSRRGELDVLVSFSGYGNLLGERNTSALRIIDRLGILHKFGKREHVDTVSIKAHILRTGSDMGQQSLVRNGYAILVVAVLQNSAVGLGHVRNRL